MADEIDTINWIVDVLEDMGVPYMIGGGVALSAWAVPRTTHDLDIVVDLAEERIPEFCSHFAPERFFIDPDAMREAFERRDRPSLGMYSFTDMETGFKADLFPLRPDDPAQQAALTRRVKAEVLEGIHAFVYTPDDLLIQKLYWHADSGSERQFQDCLNILQSDYERTVPLINWEYVETWANRLGPHVGRAWDNLKAAVSKTIAERDNK